MSGSVSLPQVGAIELKRRPDSRMMHDMMGSGMMWGMGLGGVLAIILFVLVIAALVKYLFFGEIAGH
jgi:hypothetical protein